MFTCHQGTSSLCTKAMFIEFIRLQYLVIKTCCSANPASCKVTLIHLVLYHQRLVQYLYQDNLIQYHRGSCNLVLIKHNFCALNNILPNIYADLILNLLYLVFHTYTFKNKD